MNHDFNGLEYLEVDNHASSATILLHGYGASQHDLFSLHEYLGPQCDYYFPNGPHEVPDLYDGRAWFEIDWDDLNRAMMRGDRSRFENKHPIGFDYSLELVEKFLESIRSKYKKIILGGFSQGSMLTMHIVSKRPDLVDGFILLSSSLVDLPELQQFWLKMEHKPPFMQSHGSGDPVLNYFDGKKMYSELQKAGFRGDFLTFPGAHEIPLEVLKRAQKFIAKQVS